MFHASFNFHGTVHQVVQNEKFSSIDLLLIPIGSHVYVARFFHSDFGSGCDRIRAYSGFVTSAEFKRSKNYIICDDSSRL